MSRRLIDRARGFVHDIERVVALSDEASNIRVLSDRTLYILQNLSGEDVTFLSRYGEIEIGGFYLPVTEGSPEASDVYDAVNLIRKDLNNMSVESTLECICEQLQNIATSISEAQGESSSCTIGSDVETSDGEEGGDLPDPVNGIAYEEPSEITNRKCKAANYIHGSISDVVTELKLNRADQYGFAGLAFVLSLLSTVIGGLILGPFGVLLGAVVGSFLAMATLLFKASFSLTLLETAITGDEPGAICALYEATTASGARSDYLDILDDEGATSLEIEFVEHLLTNNLLNLLFFGWGDSEGVIDDATIIHDCSTCAGVVEQWLFEADAESWTFTDLSTLGATATMAYEGATEALRDDIDIPNTPNALGDCRNHSPVISVAADGQTRVTINHDGPTDSVLTGLKAILSFDTEPDEEFQLTYTAAGQYQHTFTTVDELVGLDVRVARAQDGSPSGAWAFTFDIEDVTIELL